jgi:hypothetical protein
MEWDVMAYFFEVCSTTLHPGISVPFCSKSLLEKGDFEIVFISANRDEKLF